MLFRIESIQLFKFYAFNRSAEHEMSLINNSCVKIGTSNRSKSRGSTLCLVAAEELRLFERDIMDLANNEDLVYINENYC